MGMQITDKYINKFVNQIGMTWEADQINHQQKYVPPSSNNHQTSIVPFIFFLNMSSFGWQDGCFISSTSGAASSWSLSISRGPLLPSSPAETPKNTRNSEMSPRCYHSTALLYNESWNKYVYKHILHSEPYHFFCDTRSMLLQLSLTWRKSQLSSG